MTPTYHQQEEFQNRTKKLSELREAGVEPYPYRFDPTHTAQQLLSQYQEATVGNSDAAAQGTTIPTSLAGRLILFRAMGKNAFGHIQDATNKIQVMFNQEHTKLEGLTDPTISPLKYLEKKLDLGDFIGVTGHLFHTKTGELTLFVKQATLLCKALLPLPEKHSGLVDKETRYRKRWLDLIAHAEVRRVFILRSHMMKIIRTVLSEYDFLEVETPILQNTYGGAEARPFCSHIHATDQPVFLRIALEISLKKILVGGLERIYEIGKVFRNEGIDRTHNPEFTMLEAYAAYWDYNDLMVFVEKLVERLALELLGTTQITYPTEEGDLVIEVRAPWIRLSMKESLAHYAGIEVDRLSNFELHDLLQERTSVDVQSLRETKRGILIAMLFDELVVPKLIAPHHIIDHPIETTPLCKPHRDPVKRKEGLVERFESFLLGKELCNAYSELNDPEIQRELLEEQAKKRTEGNELAHPLDEEFLEAICQGMPPAAGIGIGLDRLAMLFTKVASIRDVLYFPIMKSHSS